MAGKSKQARPFRIFDEGARLDLPWRAYVDPHKAIDRCMSLLFDLEVGNSYTVYDAQRGTALIQVTRRVDGLRFMEDQPGRLQRALRTQAN